MIEYKYKIGDRVYFKHIYPLDDNKPMGGAYGSIIKTGTIVGYVYYILDSNFYKIKGDDGKTDYAYESEMELIESE